MVNEKKLHLSYAMLKVICKWWNEYGWPNQMFFLQLVVDKQFILSKCAVIQRLDTNTWLGTSFFG